MRVLVLGAGGFVGSWVVRKMAALHPEAQLVTSSLRDGVDLRDAGAADALFEKHAPEHVINCAAYVGGIQFGYKFPAELLAHNHRMITNVFDACRAHGVRRLVQPISNCAYPAKETYFKEENFLNGEPHESVYAYAVTRRTMAASAWAYHREYGLDTISLVLSNMYGPGDHYDVERSHALGALVKRIVDAKREGLGVVRLWGTGTPVREWLYVEDGAEALVRALTAQPAEGVVNVGHGQGVTVKALAETIREVVGWTGEFEFDTSMPDGAPHKTMDGAKGRALLGWGPESPLRAGIEKTVADYMAS